MAFATSSTAFGSTSNANQFGQKPLFGSQTQQSTTNLFGQPAGQSTASNLFGQPAGQSTGQTTTNLFGQPAASAQPTTANLFGQQAGQSTTAQPTTNLFGQQVGQSTTTQPSTNLFGQQAGQSTTTQPSTNLFGQAKQPSGFGQTTFGQPAAAAGTQSTNLFGQTSTNLFGQPQQQPQQPTQGTTNLFGGSTTLGGSSNIFGNTQQTQSNPFASLGSTNNALTAQPTLPANAFNTNTMGNTNLFGGLQKQPQQQQQPMGLVSTSQPAGPPPFTKSTKFNDLPDELKKTFEQIEFHIQGRVQISKDLQSRKLGQEATKGQDLVRTVHQDYVNTANTIKNDLHFTQDLKEKVNQAVQDTIIATRIVDGFRNSQINGSYLKDHAAFPLEYFARVTEQIKQKLAWYQSTVEQIEQKLSSLTNQTQYTPQGIAVTLQAQHTTFLALAGKTAQLDAELQKIKTLYTQLWRQRTGSVRDPFNELDMDQSASPGLGMSGMQIR